MTPKDLLKKVSSVSAIAALLFAASGQAPAKQVEPSQNASSVSTNFEQSRLNVAKLVLAPSASSAQLRSDDIDHASHASHSSHYSHRSSS